MAYAAPVRAKIPTIGPRRGRPPRPATRGDGNPVIAVASPSPPRETTTPVMVRPAASVSNLITSAQ